MVSYECVVYTNQGGTADNLFALDRCYKSVKGFLYIFVYIINKNIVKRGIKNDIERN